MCVGRKVFGWTGALLLLGALACGGDGGADPIGPDAEIAQFVGDWTAQGMTLTNVANLEVVVDLVELGATFTLNVQPSGQYTAILVFGLQASTEIGTVSVAGSTLTLNRNFPSTETAPGTFEFFGPDRFVLDGDSEFDFNLDGSSEPALAHFDFVRR